MLAGNFPETVMKTVDKYEPQSKCLFYNRNLTSKESQKKSESSKKRSSGDKSLFE